MILQNWQPVLKRCLMKNKILLLKHLKFKFSKNRNQKIFINNSSRLLIRKSKLILFFPRNKVLKASLSRVFILKLGCLLDSHLFKKSRGCHRSSCHHLISRISTKKLNSLISIMEILVFKNCWLPTWICKIVN